jgi:hypothetical protein
VVIGDKNVSRASGKILPLAPVFRARLLAEKDNGAAKAFAPRRLRTNPLAESCSAVQQGHSSMPTYYFHIDNGAFVPDNEGVDLPNLDAARREAVRAAGEMINDSQQSFWEHMTPWIMNVTDDQHRLLFTLQFAAKVPSGEAFYIPRQREAGSPSTEAGGRELRSRR